MQELPQSALLHDALGDAAAFDDFDSDLDEAPDAEVAAAEEATLTQATAAHTLDELQRELTTLHRLEQLARQVYAGGEDRKWQELAELLNTIFASPTLAHV